MYLERDWESCFIFLRKAAICLFFLGAHTHAGQAQGGDSLRVERLAALADLAMLSSVDSGFYYARQIIEYGEANNFEFALATGYEKMGWTHWVEGNYADGLKYSLDAVRIFEQHPPSRGLTNSFLAAGRNLFEQRSYTMALTFYNRAEEIAEKLGLEDLLVETYRDLGGICIFTGEYEKGIAYCKKGLEIAARIGERESGPIFYSHLALMHFNQGDIEQSIDYNWRAILEGRLTGNRRIVAVGFERLASVDLKNGNYDEAIRKANETLEMGQELGSSLITMRAYEVLSKAYEGKKLYKQSLDYHKAYSEISDSTYNADKESIIASMEAVYDLESKQREIELLETERALNEQESKAKNYFIVLSIVAIGLLIALTLSLYRASRIQTVHNSELQSKNKEIAEQAKKLGEMNATKSKIFSIIGHDLRSSVANLKQLMDLLNNQMITLKELKEVAPEAKQSVDASFDVLDNLLHWGLAQMEGIRTNIVAVDLLSVVKDLTDNFSLALERKAISLKLEVVENTRVMADGPQLTVVLRNLIANAIKFTKNGGSITVSAVPDGGEVLISVADTGVGISGDKLALLFKKETHYSEAGTNHEKGTGLGLLLCQEFVENMGSHLQVDSELGKGTRFWFALKRA